MMVDASAMVTIMTDESDAELLTQALEAAQNRFTTPVAQLEACLAIIRKLRCTAPYAGQVVGRFLSVADIRVEPILEEHALVGAQSLRYLWQGPRSSGPTQHG